MYIHLAVEAVDERQATGVPSAHLEILALSAHSSGACCGGLGWCLALVQPQRSYCELLMWIPGSRRRAWEGVGRDYSCRYYR